MRSLHTFLFRVLSQVFRTQRASHRNMQLDRLWCQTIIAVVIVTSASCQIVPKLQVSRRSISKSNANTEEALRRTTTKQNHSNFANGFQSHHDEVDDSDGLRSDSTSRADDSLKPHSRKKRLIWITDDGRLALPPGTVLSITPTLSLPLVRYPLEGFLSNMTMSFPLTIDFDKLGLTDNENPLGVLPPVLARSMGRAAGSYLGERSNHSTYSESSKFAHFHIYSWLHRWLFVVETNTVDGRRLLDNIEAEAADIAGKSKACISRRRTCHFVRHRGRFAGYIRNGWQSVSATCHVRSAFDEIVESPRTVRWNR